MVSRDLLTCPRLWRLCKQTGKLERETDQRPGCLNSLDNRSIHISGTSCEALFKQVVTWTAFPYHTLHRQPIPITDCMLYCVGRLAIVPPNSLRCDCVFAHAHLCHSYFILECPKHWNI